MPKESRLDYGEHPDQHVRCRVAQNAPRGTAVLVHGGYWRERHTADLMIPLAEDLSCRGWATVNIEYRRGPQAVWPTPLEDVRSACAVASRWAASFPGPLVGVGHSVGGQLALLAGDPLDAVVALAPVTDAARTHAEALGDGAAQEYFGAAPADEPGRYAGASPSTRLPVGRPALLVHGGNDDRVPLQHSLDYLIASLETGDVINGEFPHRLSHLEAIDPGAGHWESVLRWMGRQVARSSASEA